MTTRPHIPTLVAEIARYLPEWEPVLRANGEEYDHYGKLRHRKFGAIVGIHYHHNRLKATASLQINRDYAPYGTKPPQASFDPKRPARAIARDIERRVLEPSLPIHATCERARHEAENRKAREEQVLAGLRHLIGADEANLSWDGKKLYVSRGNFTEHTDDYLDAQIEVRLGGKRVEFQNLTVSTATAEKIINLLVNAGK